MIKKNTGFFMLVILVICLMITACGVEAGGPPKFSHQPEFYSEELTLRLTHPHKETKIFYTLDGSMPNSRMPEDSFQVMQEYPAGELTTWETRTYEYTSELTFTLDTIPEHHYEKINTTNSNEFFTPEEVPLKAVVVRAIAFHPEHGESEVVSGTFFLTPPDFKEIQLPVISIITEPKGFFDYQEGIYVAGKSYDEILQERSEEEPTWRWPTNYNQRGSDWEREAYLEFYEEGQKSPVLAHDIGIRINGNSSRSYPKKSLRIYARSDYGENRFRHEFFPGLTQKNGSGEPANVFNRLILRNSGQDGHDIEGETESMIRDALAQSLVKHYPSIEYQAYRPTVHFINGVYWGIINVRERIDDNYFEEHYNIAEEDLVILQNEEVYHGKDEDVLDYLSLADFIEEFDLTEDAHVEELAKLIDIESLTYYNIGNMFLTHSYWPIGGGGDNRYWRKRVDYDPKEMRVGHDGRWRWMFKDMDKSLVNYDQNMYWYLVKDDSVHKKITLALWSNEGYREYYLNTLADEMNSSFNQDRMIAMINKTHGKIASELERNASRWQVGVDGLELFTHFAQKRPEVFITQTLDFFKLNQTVQVHLLANPGHGRIKINSLEISKKLPGVEDPSSWIGEYFSEVPVEITAMPNDGYRFVGWEGDAMGKPASFKVALTEDFVATAIFTPATTTAVK